jgi:hypothetical protein
VDTNDEPLDIDSTTGEFRFILTVKSSDNINKMSSTTIRLEKNSVEFLNWADEETMFVNTLIDKRFRIYGDAQPTRVRIMQDMGEGKSDIEKVDVTDYLKANSGSEYPYDYECSTQGLKFDSVGDYYVYLEITLDNGQVIRTENKKFIIKPSVWTEITNTNQIETGYVYLIMNVSSDDFAYDNGNYPYVKAVYDESCYFKFEKVGNSYLIQNVSTGEYANINGYTLNMSATNQPSAAQFVLEYNQDGQYFKIGTKVRQYHNYYYYWRQIEGSNTITIATGNSDIMRWKIYKQSIN